VPAITGLSTTFTITLPGAVVSCRYGTVRQKLSSPASGDVDMERLGGFGGPPPAPLHPLNARSLLSCVTSGTDAAPPASGLRCRRNEGQATRYSCVLCREPAAAAVSMSVSGVCPLGCRHELGPVSSAGVSFLVFLSLLCPFYEGSCVRFKVWLGLFFIFILGWLDVTQASEPRRRNKGTTAAARPRKMIQAAENGNRKNATSLAESQPSFVRGQHTRTRAWLTESAAGPATKPPSQPPRHC